MPQDTHHLSISLSFRFLFLFNRFASFSCICIRRISKCVLACSPASSVRSKSSVLGFSIEIIWQQNKIDGISVLSYRSGWWQQQQQHLRPLTIDIMTFWHVPKWKTNEWKRLSFFRYLFVQRASSASVKRIWWRLKMQACKCLQFYFN